MAIVSMTPAVAGSVALAAEYNKLITNITDLDTRTTAVEAAVGGGSGEVPRKGGEYVFSSQGSIGTASLLTAWTAVGTPNGVSHSAGTFTLTEAGLYVITCNIRVTVGSGDKYLMITGPAAAANGTGDTWAKTSTNAVNLSCSVIRRCTAGQTFKTYAYVATGPGTVGREQASDAVPGLSVYKVGN